jgi:MYXO-CTERM domain-containing protein
MGLRTLLLAVLFSVTPLMGRAEVLLVIDDSNPSDITFTATDNTPGTSGVTFYPGGITLSGFFSASVTENSNLTDTSPTLTSGPSNSGSYFNFAGAGLLLPSSPDDVLTQTGPSLYTGPVTIEPGTVAFTGSASFDLSDTPLEALLPAPGSSGALDIDVSYAGNSFSGTTVGEWSIIAAPEPSSWALALVAIFILAWRRHRRRLN